MFNDMDFIEPTASVTVKTPVTATALKVPVHMLGGVPPIAEMFTLVIFHYN